MGIYGNYAKALIEKQLQEQEILQEIQIGQEAKSKLRFDAYLPNSFETSLKTVKGAYIEIYDTPHNRILRLNLCFAWIITSHKAKKVNHIFYDVWKEVNNKDRAEIQRVLSTVTADGLTVYQQALKFFDLPLDWIMPNFLNMTFEPNEVTKDKLEADAWKNLEKVREAKRKEAERQERINKYRNMYQ